MNSANLVGQTLDGKYKIERELGRGGMGAVYLATHLGTERAVALKVIAPEYMRREEFVERFRREARAAGRLRHPNVVDVTDFGLAEIEQGRVAYLVMEYLDGCTLGEILEEEKHLPLSWTLDILEQTCSAVDEAHRQGIIHRDLKPDNIWLEPNQRGGYTVKVLDFGIAKLEEMKARDDEKVQNPKFKVQSRETSLSNSPGANDSRAERKTANGKQVFESETIALPPDSNANVAEDSTLNFEASNLESPISNRITAVEQSNGDSDESSTLALPAVEDYAGATAADGTAIFPAARLTSAAAAPQDAGAANATALEAAGTKILGAPATDGKTFQSVRSTAALTRVGAVLGTPLYMSPEQCRGDKLDPRADVYSLGVIAYQMLAGETPFTGKYTEVLEAHKTQPPPALEAKKVPAGVKRVVASAMAKTPDERPATALAFASKMRAQSEGIGTLLQRALVIYSHHLPKFLGLALLLFLPMMLLTSGQVVASLLTVNGVLPATSGTALTALFQIATPLVNVLFAAVMVGVTTWIVVQHLAAPLRPLSVRPALREARKHLRTFAGTVMLTSVLQLAAMIGSAIVCGILLVVFYKLIGVGAVFVLLSLATVILLTAASLSLFVLFSLVTPVVMMENLRGRAAISRSIQLVRRSLRTVMAVVFINFLVPVIGALVLSVAINFMIAGVRDSFKINSKAAEQTPPSAAAAAAAAAPAEETSPRFEHVAPGVGVQIKSENQKGEQKSPEQRRAEKIQEVWSNSAFQIVWLPIVVMIGSLASVVTALLYLKTRQAGGETLQQLLAQFGSESDEATPKSNWQERISARLAQSGRQSGGTSAASKT